MPNPFEYAKIGYKYLSDIIIKTGYKLQNNLCKLKESVKKLLFIY